MTFGVLNNSQGHLKAGMYGTAKSGKTWTSTLLAIGTKKFLNLPGPIAFFDTESGSGYVADMVKEQTGQDLLGVRARSFKDLMQFTRDCEEAKASVAIIDSLSHVWVELMDSYLAQLNEKRRERNFSPLMKLEFSHWSAVKKLWSEWPDWFLNSPMSVIVCGRSAGIWEFSKNEETGRKELEKTGTRMKAEQEMAYESSLLIELERELVPNGQGGNTMVHVATVVGDRFGVLDGKSCSNPTIDFFLPHLKKLKPGSHAPVNVASKTETGADVEGAVGWDREKQARTIYAEEIQGCIVSRFPGQSAEEKKKKADILDQIFATRSWTKVEQMPSETLREGLGRLKQALGMSGDVGGPPNAPGANAGPTPEDQIPGAEVPPKSDPECIEMRQILERDKIRESTLLSTLGSLGMIKEGLKSLEEAQLQKPDVLALTIKNWPDLSKAIREAYGANA